MLTAGLKLTGTMFLEAVIKKIELVKKLFVFYIESGKECYIPEELSHN